MTLEYVFEKKGPKWPTKKTEIFKPPILKIFFAKISEVGPRINRID